jgi:hypothetical protein
VLAAAESGSFSLGSFDDSDENVDERCLPTRGLFIEPS